MNTKNFNLSQLQLNSSSKESMINENNFFIDSLMPGRALDFITELPGNPNNGDVYITSPLSTKLVDDINKIVIYHGNFGFKFITPQENMIFFVANQYKSYIYKDSAWKIFQSSSSGSGSGTNDYNDLINTPVIPAKTSDLQNDSDFQTSAQISAEIDSKISQIPSNIDDNLLTSLTKTYSIDKIRDLIRLSGGGSSSGGGYYTGDYKQSAQSQNHAGWLLCDGSEISRLQYSDLFSLIGENFGAGDGSTTFNLPDFRGRIFGGIGQGAGLTNRNLGEKIGEEVHILTVDEMPSHSHGIIAHNGSGSRLDLNNNYAKTNPISSGIGENTTDSGGDQAHNNMQPTLFAGNYFIYSGVIG